MFRRRGGLIARAIVPGRQRLGFVMTTLLGVAGSVVGGLVASAIAGRSFGELHGAGFIGSLIGAILLLVVALSVFRRPRHGVV